MECNKEEAMRAKEIAEKKMQSNDFEGARKIAMKAKHLNPELENINQILSICDVYCSAEIRLPGLEKDWYSVLQVEKLADESTIKKQYRKLALVLHPDKNQFPGAEGAFKLVCEANAVLSDPAKRSSYDNKTQILAKPDSENPPNHQSNRNYQFNKQYAAQSSIFSSVNIQRLKQYSNRCLQTAYDLRALAKNLMTKAFNLSPNFLLSGKIGVTSDGDADIEDVTEQENLGDAAATDLKSEFTSAQFARKSSRTRHHVSYKEAVEDDYARPLKRAHTAKETNAKEHKNVVDGKDSVPSSSKSGNKESLKEKNEGCDKEGEIRGVSGGRSTVECPDTEFSNFDKLREESQFHANQFWACYDTTSDSMPRFYAKVSKVCSSPFELNITWLEAVPIDDSWEKWVDEELPVGCGSFKLGTTDKVSGCLSLSHQVHCEKGKRRGSFFIYPREGEIWALYRDWDISWSVNPDTENLKKFKYEIVEVLSDYAAGVGIKVVYMDKCTGFVSLFQRVVQSKTSSFIIAPTELYKFSHCVPSFKMTGAEREGVPIGSFELDPASLPLNPDDLYFPSKAEIESREGF